MCRGGCSITEGRGAATWPPHLPLRRLHHTHFGTTPQHTAFQLCCIRHHHAAPAAPASYPSLLASWCSLLSPPRHMPPDPHASFHTAMGMAARFFLCAKTVLKLESRQLDEIGLLPCCCFLPFVGVASSIRAPTNRDRARAAKKPVHHRKISSWGPHGRTGAVQ